MALPVTKRQRSDTAGTGQPQSHMETPSQLPFRTTRDLQHAMDQLDDATIRRILLQSAAAIPTVAALIAKEVNDQAIREARRVINFDPYSKSVWHSLNRQYSSMRGSKQYDIAFDVADGIQNTIKKISDEASKPHASYGTKKSGMETLRKIGKTICLSSTDVVGHEVQKQFGFDDSLECAMMDILTSMTGLERETLASENDGRSSFLQKMEELRDLAAEYCLFEKMEDAIIILANEGSGEEEEDEDDEAEEDEGSSSDE